MRLKGILPNAKGPLWVVHCLLVLPSLNGRYRETLPLGDQSSLSGESGGRVPLGGISQWRVHSL